MTQQPAYTVLILDDSPINIRIVSEVLQEHCRVLAATSFDLALRVIDKNTPDLVLLDIMMPEVDGFEACKRLKSLPETRDMPIIFLTSTESVSSEIKGLSLGAVDFIQKPIVPDILRSRVLTHLELQTRTRELEEAYHVINEQNRRVSAELAVARDLQRGFLPEIPDSDARFSAAAKMEPALELGGDFYDLFYTDDQTICFCIGDVSGKGVPAAMLMGMCRSLIRSKARYLESPADILASVNRSLLEGNHACMFVTLYLAILNIRTGRLDYSNAGHCAPVVINDVNGTRMLEDRHGIPVGVTDGEYGETREQLEKGDKLILYTDGVTEASNQQHDIYGEDRFMQTLQQSDRSTPDNLVASITDALDRFRGRSEQSDDVTLLTLSWHGDLAQELSTVRERVQLASLETDSIDFTRFDTLVQTARPEVDDLTQVVHLIMDEMISNVLLHGRFTHSDGHVDVELALGPEDIILEFSDPGMPFNPVEVPIPDLESGLQERQLGGLGIFLCRQYMEQISYRRVGGRNVTRMTRRLAKASSTTC